MLTTVEVISSRGANLTLPLQDASSGLLVKSIEGLDPVKATIVSSTFANLPGAQRQASHREVRNIVLTLGIEPDYVNTTVQGLRNLLYSFLLPQSQVTLRFYLDGVAWVDIQGEVETFTAPVFSSEPEVVVSLLCFDPDFYEPTAVVVPGVTTATTAAVAVNYQGNIPTGFVLHVDVNHSVAGLTIRNTAPDGTELQMPLVKALVTGDAVDLSTVVGDKYALLTHLGSQNSVLYGVDPESNWVQLYPGVNNIRVVADGAAMPFTITYNEKYGGL